MEFKYHKVNINMKPHDMIQIHVGISHKCDIKVTANGELRIYYEEGKAIEI